MRSQKANQRVVKTLVTWLAVYAYGASLALSADVMGEWLKTNASLKDVSIVFFDVETTGFSAQKDRIVEIGAVRYENGEIVDEKSWLIDPGRRIPRNAINVHGIDNTMVKGQPGFAEIYPEVEAFFGDAILVAHNARFDVGFLRAELLRAGRPLPSNAVIDSLKLFRSWFPDSTSHTLKNLTSHLGIDVEGFHRAEADAFFIFLIMEEGFAQRSRSVTVGEFLADAGGSLYF